MLNGLSLFSGIGGIDEALASWVRPVAYCENDAYAQGVLFSRMSTGELGLAPIWDDVTTLRADDIPVHVDIIYGGFPCQDISVAGVGGGLAGKRSGLFYEIIRLTKELNPSFVFLENVPAIRTRGLPEVIQAFSNLRYDCRWTRLSAAEVGAPHLRERWFLLAHANRELVQQQSGRGSRQNRQEEIQPRGALENGATTNADSLPKELRPTEGRKHQPFSVWSLDGNNWDDYARFFLGVDNGVPHRVDRLRGVGNAVVPVQAEEAFKRLVGIE